MLQHYTARKQSINDKLQGSAVTHLRCGRDVDNQILIKLIKVYCWVCQLIFFVKSVNIWQSYKQERGCLMHFARLTNTLLKDEESARDNHVLACHFAKYSSI